MQVEYVNLPKKLIFYESLAALAIIILDMGGQPYENPLAVHQVSGVAEKNPMKPSIGIPFWSTNARFYLCCLATLQSAGPGAKETCFSSSFSSSVAKFKEDLITRL